VLEKNWAKKLRYLDFEARGHFVSRVYEQAAGRLAHLD
jgi:hypothetical protein